MLPLVRVCAVLVALAAAVPLLRAAPAAFSDEFTDTAVISSGLTNPTDLAFTPDGRMLITTQGGQLYVYANGQLLPTPALDLSARTCTRSERGLLGVAVDPQFASNRFIYLFYTWNRTPSPSAQPRCDQTSANTPAPLDGPVNRVARFVLPDTNQVDPSSQLVLVDGMPSPAGNHNGGDLLFGQGADEHLYISIGDGGCDYAGGGCAGGNDATLDMHVLTGKLLRVTRDGGIPPGNPYQGAGTAACRTTGRTTPGTTCQEIVAYGLRNPFRIALDPNSATTRLFINDVGQGAWEEIDAYAPGSHYGWNQREGFCANGATTGCRSVPGAVVGGLTDPRTGLQATVSSRLNPRTVDLTFTTEPAGLRLQINGTPVQGGEVVRSWEGYQLDVSGPVQGAPGSYMRLDAWEDGAPVRRTITTGAAPVTYRAIFAPAEVSLMPVIAR